MPIGIDVKFRQPDLATAKHDHPATRTPAPYRHHRKEKLDESDDGLDDRAVRKFTSRRRLEALAGRPGYMGAGTLPRTRAPCARRGRRWRRTDDALT